MHDLPEEALLFLLGSRYCETDRLSETAWNLFGNAPTGWDRVQAICDYVHRLTHFLTRGLQHVSTEMSLHVLAYNLKRVINLLGMSTTMKAMRLLRA